MALYRGGKKAAIPPGKYDVQINLVDEFGRKFAFPRTSLALLAADTVKKL